MMALSHVFFVEEQRFLEYTGLYVCERDIKLLDGKYKGCYIALIYTDGVPLGAFQTERYHRVVLAEENNERIERLMAGTAHPVWDLVTELRYNPDVGSQVPAARKRFRENVESKKD